MAPQKRACDCCYLRKVKCGGTQPCPNCLKAKLNCTYINLRRKSGPKGIHAKSRAYIAEAQAHALSDYDVSSALFGDSAPSPDVKPASTGLGTASSQFPNVPRQVLHECITIFGKKLYGIWPLLTAPDLLEMLESGYDDLETYSLLTSLSAATLSELQIEVKSDDGRSFSAAIVARDAIAARKKWEYMETFSLNCVLTSYFLHRYYGRHLNQEVTAFMYIREAISFAQACGLHIESKYTALPLKESQMRRKLYYLLYMTERYLCIKGGYPVVLDSTVKLPELHNEESPLITAAFLNLVKVFSAPGKQFFDRWDVTNSETSYSRNWLMNLQKQLQVPLSMPELSDDVQIVDILVSRHWIRALAWKLSLFSGHLSETVQTEDDVLLSMSYPFEIARDLLMEANSIPPSAFEVHGPGMEVKLFEVANSVADLVICQDNGVPSFQSDVLQGVSKLIFSIEVKNQHIRQLFAQKVDIAINQMLRVPGAITLDREFEELLDDNGADSTDDSADSLEGDAKERLAGALDVFDQDPLRDSLSDDTFSDSHTLSDTLESLRASMFASRSPSVTSVTFD